MKTHWLVATTTLTFLALSACSKTEPQSTAPETTAKAPAAPPAESTPPPAAPALDKAATDAQAQAAAAQNAAAQAAANAQTDAANAQADAAKNAQATTASLNSKTQSIIDQAKQLLADNKPADALKALGNLAGAKLTPAQQSTIDNLKQRAQELLQKMAASDLGQKASDAVGGLLKK